MGYNCHNCLFHKFQKFISHIILLHHTVWGRGEHAHTHTKCRALSSSYTFDPLIRKGLSPSTIHTLCVCMLRVCVCSCASERRRPTVSWGRTSTSTHSRSRWAATGPVIYKVLRSTPTRPSWIWGQPSWPSAGQCAHSSWSTSCSDACRRRPGRAAEPGDNATSARRWFTARCQEHGRCCGAYKNDCLSVTSAYTSVFLCTSICRPTSVCLCTSIYTSVYNLNI